MAQVQQPQPDAELESQIDGLLVEMDRQTKGLDEIDARRNEAASRSPLIVSKPEPQPEPEVPATPIAAAPSTANDPPAETASVIAPPQPIPETASPAPAAELSPDERAINAMLDSAAMQAAPAPAAQHAAALDAEPDGESERQPASPAPLSDDDLSASLSRAIAEAENRAQELADELGPADNTAAPPRQDVIGVRGSFTPSGNEPAEPSPPVGSATSLSALDAELALGASESSGDSNEELAALEAALEQAGAQAVRAAGTTSGDPPPPSLNELADAVADELAASAAASPPPIAEVPPTAAPSGFESAADVVDQVLETQAAAAQPAGSVANAKPVIPHQAATIPVMVAAAGVPTPPIGQSAAATEAALRSHQPAAAPHAPPSNSDALLKAQVVGVGSSIGRLFAAVFGMLAYPLKPLSSSVRDYVGYLGLITAFYGVCVVAFALIRAANMPAEPELPTLPESAQHAGAHADPNGHEAHDPHAETLTDPAAPIDLKRGDHADEHHADAAHDPHADAEHAGETHADEHPAPSDHADPPHHDDQPHGGAHEPPPTPHGH